MRYLVVARFIIRGKVWNTLQHEFDDEISAENYAEEMYASAKRDRGEAVIVQLYELNKSYN